MEFVQSMPGSTPRDENAGRVNLGASLEGSATRSQSASVALTLSAQIPSGQQLPGNYI